MKKHLIVALAVLVSVSACSKTSTEKEAVKVESSEQKDIQLEMAIKDKFEQEAEEEKRLLALDFYQRSNDAQNHLFEYAYDRNTLKNDFLQLFGFDQVNSDKNLLAMLPNLHRIPDKPKYVSNYDFNLYLPGLLTQIDRSEENIKRLFANNKKEIYSWVDSYLYYKSQAFLFTNALLATHKQMSNSENYSTWMADFIKQPTSSVDNRAELVAKFEKQFGSINHLDLVIKAKSEYEAEVGSQLRMKYWLYSFWIRRFQEGNTNAVLDILSDISQHYDQK